MSKRPRKRPVAPADDAPPQPLIPLTSGGFDLCFDQILHALDAARAGRDDDVAAYLIPVADFLTLAQRELYPTLDGQNGEKD